MATTRYYYSSAISEFIGEEETSIVGKLTGSSQHDINKKTSSSWKEEIKSLKEALKDYSGRGSIYLEYNIPRMGRRVDAIVLIDGIVFILEYKTGRQTFNQSARNQVWDYALDLKNFHADSKDRILVPIVVVPCALNEDCQLTPKSSEDKVYEPLFTNTHQLGTAIQNILDQATVQPSQSDEAWANSGYEPTPTIIEAAIALYEKNNVADIKDKGAVYLSGNYPLVEVLQEALTRDYMERERIIKSNTRTKKEDAKRKVKASIQMIHHYRDLYLEGVDVTLEGIKPIPGCTDTVYIPAEQVAIFDEAQRAWTKEELQRFMREKKNIQNFPYSEPEYLISCMDRQRDWGVVVCLVGNGQSINKGEAGLKEWIESILRRYRSWDVYISETILESEGLSDEQKRDIKPQLKDGKDLHLEMSMRSFRSESVSLFINQLLDLKVEEARSTLYELRKNNYPIVLTRSLERAKRWLRSKKGGNERMGLLASSKAERLKAISINVKYSPNFVHWFLEDSQDIRSSDTLEDALTEFEVQGLEIDWACVAWDADLRLSEDKRTWEHFQLRGGGKWQNINKPVNQEYQINAYRVLLTRARQGIVVLIPEGDDTDTTRKREWYDRTYNYLKGIGIPEII